MWNEIKNLLTRNKEISAFSILIASLCVLFHKKIITFFGYQEINFSYLSEIILICFITAIICILFLTYWFVYWLFYFYKKYSDEKEKESIIYNLSNEERAMIIEMYRTNDVIEASRIKNQTTLNSLCNKGLISFSRNHTTLTSYVTCWVNIEYGDVIKNYLEKAYKQNRK